LKKGSQGKECGGGGEVVGWEKGSFGASGKGWKESFVAKKSARGNVGNGLSPEEGGDGLSVRAELWGEDSWLST